MDDNVLIWHHAYPRGHPMSQFSQVYRTDTFGNGSTGLWQNILIPIHFQHSSLIFIILMEIFCFEKMLMCTHFEGGSEKNVCFKHFLKLWHFSWPIKWFIIFFKSAFFHSWAILASHKILHVHSTLLVLLEGPHLY